MRFALSLSVLLGAAALVVDGHSWVGCTKYDSSGGPPAGFFEASRCSGYIRAYGKFEDVHRNRWGDQYFPWTIDGPNVNNMANTACFPIQGGTNRRDQSNYTPQHPMATYAIGERVRVLWPAKNHAAVRGGNAGSLKISAICDDGDQDLSRGQVLTDDNLLVDVFRHGRQVNRWGETTSFAPSGYSPEGCPGTVGFFQGHERADFSPCSATFTIPNGLPVGKVCTFYWIWRGVHGADEQKPIEQVRYDAYSSCWEARIVAGNGGAQGGGNERGNGGAGHVDRRLLDKLVFNWRFYKNLYPDLAAAFGEDRAGYEAHWLDNGIREGRQASAEFNVNIYKQRFADLRAAFGEDNAAYVRHYVTNGKHEGRSAV